MMLLAATRLEASKMTPLPFCSPPPWIQKNTGNFAVGVAEAGVKTLSERQFSDCVRTTPWTAIDCGCGQTATASTFEASNGLLSGAGSCGGRPRPAVAEGMPEL